METLGRYHLLRLLRSNEGAEIWEGSYGDAGFERQVIIKRRSEDEVGEDPTRAFLDEARVLSRIHHDNVVQVIDFGRDDNRPYLVLEKVEGVDLLALAELSRRSGGLPEAAAIHVANEICRGLDHVHALRGPSGEPLGIVHRDVTPTNVLVAWSGAVRIADFGIAVFRERLERTRAGFVKGTLAYMAPEQLVGGLADARTDLFGLGCVLHWMLVGRSPAEGTSIDTPRFQLSSDLPDDLRAIIERATRPKRQDRYPSARALADDLWDSLNRRTRQNSRAYFEDWLRTLRAPAPAESVETTLERPLPASAAPRKVTQQIEFEGASLSIDAITDTSRARDALGRDASGSPAALAPSLLIPEPPPFTGEDTTDRSITREAVSLDRRVRADPSVAPIARNEPRPAGGQAPAPAERAPVLRRGRLLLALSLMLLVALVAGGAAVLATRRPPRLGPMPAPAPVVLAVRTSTASDTIRSNEGAPRSEDPMKVDGPPSSPAGAHRGGAPKKARPRDDRVIAPALSDEAIEDISSLDRRLEKIGARLLALAGERSLDEVRRLESRYFEARARLGPNLSEQARRDLSREIRELEDSLE